MEGMSKADGRLETWWWVSAQSVMEGKVREGVVETK